MHGVDDPGQECDSDVWGGELHVDFVEGRVGFGDGHVGSGRDQLPGGVQFGHRDLHPWDVGDVVGVAGFRVDVYGLVRRRLLWSRHLHGDDECANDGDGDVRSDLDLAWPREQRKVA